MATPTEYDVAIVGGGIAGCSLAHALSTINSKQPLKIALFERSLAEPDRIVGELLQPGGVHSLEDLGIRWTLEDIDAQPEYGYCVVNVDGSRVKIPYPKGEEGRSFHHGRFIMRLREAASQASGVKVFERTVSGFVMSESGKKVVGVRATHKATPDVVEEYRAKMVVVADGCFSNFRATVMGVSSAKPVTKSHFVGLVLNDAKLPMKHHGTVALCKNSGPVLMYQIGENDTRMLVNVKNPVPANLHEHIRKEIVPSLPVELQDCVLSHLDKDRLRRMPNSFLPPVPQYPSSAALENVFLLGDAWNMRHPLTGGGMTVAFHDVVVLRDTLQSYLQKSDSTECLRNWKEMRQKVLKPWYWNRKPLGATVNILSVALYDLFGGDEEELEILRTGCFKYFERGGECVDGPVRLLSGLSSSPLLLFSHFFAVAFYSMYILFVSPPSSNPTPERPNRSVIGKSIMVFRVLYTAVVVFAPLLYTEISWLIPSISWWMMVVLGGGAFAMTQWRIDF